MGLPDDFETVPTGSHRILEEADLKLQKLKQLNEDLRLIRRNIRELGQQCRRLADDTARFIEAVNQCEEGEQK